MTADGFDCEQRNIIRNISYLCTFFSQLPIFATSSYQFIYATKYSNHTKEGPLILNQKEFLKSDSSYASLGIFFYKNLLKFTHEIQCNFRKNHRIGFNISGPYKYISNI